MLLLLNACLACSWKTLRNPFMLKHWMRLPRFCRTWAYSWRGFFSYCPTSSTSVPLNLTIFLCLLTQTSHHPFYKNISPYAGLPYPTFSSLRWPTSHSKHSPQSICLQGWWLGAHKVPAMVPLVPMKTSLPWPKVHG